MIAEAPISVPQVSIRPSRPQELQQVIRLIEANGLSADREPGYVESRVTQKTRTTLVADEMGKVVGSVVIEEAAPPYFGINYFVVDENHRGQHIGETLIERAESVIRAKGGTRILTVVHNDDPSLIAMYEHFGYKKEPGEPVLMRKDL